MKYTPPSDQVPFNQFEKSQRLVPTILVVVAILLFVCLFSYFYAYQQKVLRQQCNTYLSFSQINPSWKASTSTVVDCRGVGVKLPE